MCDQEPYKFATCDFWVITRPGIPLCASNRAKKNDVGLEIALAIQVSSEPMDLIWQQNRQGKHRGGNHAFQLYCRLVYVGSLYAARNCYIFCASCTWWSLSIFRLKRPLCEKISLCRSQKKLTPDLLRRLKNAHRRPLQFWGQKEVQTCWTSSLPSVFSGFIRTSTRAQTFVSFPCGCEDRQLRPDRGVPTPQSCVKQHVWSDFLG